MKFYYDAVTNNYVALHNVNAKDVPSGYIEVTEEQFNNHYLSVSLDEYIMGLDLSNDSEYYDAVIIGLE